MKIEDSTYETPHTEIVLMESVQTIAASNLENPEEGGEWGWD